MPLGGGGSNNGPVTLMEYPNRVSFRIAALAPAATAAASARETLPTYLPLNDFGRIPTRPPNTCARQGCLFIPRAQA